MTPSTNKFTKLPYVPGEKPILINECPQLFAVHCMKVDIDVHICKELQRIPTDRKGCSVEFFSSIELIDPVLFCIENV